MRRALHEDMQYDDDDYTRLADAALTWLCEHECSELLAAAAAIEAQRSVRGAGSRALDMGRAWSVEFLRERAADAGA